MKIQEVIFQKITLLETLPVFITESVKEVGEVVNDVRVYGVKVYRVRTDGVREDDVGPDGVILNCV